MTVAEAVTRRLSSDSRVDAGKIIVAASDGGTVVLNGSVHTYAQKIRAAELAERVPGVTLVRNELEVKLTIGDYRTDATLLMVIRDVLDALTGLPDERPIVSVKDGWVTLQGVVRWPFQKQIAEESLLNIAGIRGITNAIVIAVPPVRREIALAH